MTAKHSEASIEQALVKVFSRGDRSAKSVAEDLNVSYYTLKYWTKSKSVTRSGVPATREKRPQDWTAAEQLVAWRKPMACPGSLAGVAPRKRHIRPLSDRLADRPLRRPERRLWGTSEVRTLKD